MKGEKRHSKVITSKEDKEYLFNLSIDDCARLSVIMECFGEFNGKRRFNTYDILEVPAGVFGPEGMKNKTAFTTTVGLFIFNRAFIEKDLVPHVGYINSSISKKMFKKINEKLSYGVLEDDIDLEVLKRYTQLTQKFQPYCDILSPTFTPNMMNVSSDLDKKRKELLKKYEKGIQEADPSEVQKLEKELLEEAKELLKDDPSMDMIDSGAGASWDNNFKNIFAIRGAVKNSDPSKGDYSVILGNFMDGVGPEEYAKFADSLTGGPYARAVSTSRGGAMEKQFVRAFQHVVVDMDCKDCGTKKTIEVMLDGKAIEMWMYSFIQEGNNLVELTSKNKDKYLGKKVRMRYSGLCEHKKGICRTCAGSLFERLEIKNVGVASYAICSKVKLISMKAFHDSTVKVSKMSDYGYAKIFDGVK